MSGRKQEDKGEYLPEIQPQESKATIEAILNLNEVTDVPNKQSISISFPLQPQSLQNQPLLVNPQALEQQEQVQESQREEIGEEPLRMQHLNKLTSMGQELQHEQDTFHQEDKTVYITPVYEPSNIQLNFLSQTNIPQNSPDTFQKTQRASFQKKQNLVYELPEKQEDERVQQQKDANLRNVALTIIKNQAERVQEVVSPLVQQITANQEAKKIQIIQKQAIEDKIFDILQVKESKNRQDYELRPDENLPKDQMQLKRFSFFLFLALSLWIVAIFVI